MTDKERAEHAARLRGLLYLACPDAPAIAISATAEAIAESAEETPQEPVRQAAQLSQPRHPRFAEDQLNLSGADLSGANLSGADLRRANLSGATLYRANLASANLTGVNLTGAHLFGANLTETDLNGADLTDADLNSADLTDANLRGTQLAGAVHMPLPAGATWDSFTRWPAALASVVIEQSDEVRPGVYQVRGEPSPDRSTVGV